MARPRTQGAGDDGDEVGGAEGKDLELHHIKAYTETDSYP